MERFLQFFFFAVIIAAASASSARPNGCYDGQVLTTVSESGCNRCECMNNEIKCKDILQPCEAEGSYNEFYHYPRIPEPPLAPKYDSAPTVEPSGPQKEPEHAELTVVELPPRKARKHTPILYRNTPRPTQSPIPYAH